MFPRVAIGSLGIEKPGAMAPGQMRTGISEIS
jgi:hypothetical protein